MSYNIEYDDITEHINMWKTEIKRGIITMCLLVAVQQEENYGYIIAKKMKELLSGVLEIEEGTLYPILRRLEMYALLKSQWKIVHGKPRKYYSLTEKGSIVLSLMLQLWNILTVRVSNFLYGGGEKNVNR